MTQTRRYERHGRWVGLYAAVSFVLLFVIGFYFEFRIYSKLAPFCGKSQELKCSGDAEKSVVFLINNDEAFVKLSLYRLILHIAVILIIAGAIALFISLWWKSEKFVIPMVFYVSVPLIVQPDPIGFELVAFFYGSLIYMMRFALRFNPHLKEIEKGNKKEVLQSIFQMYHQYAILSLAVVGLTLTTFLFGFEQTFRDYWLPAWTNFAVIRMPLYLSHAAFLGIGITGLALGVCREFHVKQEEVLTTILALPRNK